MLVFRLPHLQQDARRAKSIEQLRSQLNSLSVHSSSSPLLLVGTCKDEAVQQGGANTLTELSAVIGQSLKDCPAFRNVVRNGDLLFFGVENSSGFAGDEAIRQLVLAIEKTAVELPSMKQRVPTGWLAVYDRLRKELQASPPQQWLSLTQVTAIAKQCGLPHRGASMPLEREVSLMLGHLHSIGALSWFDLPQLRELVILDSQWIVDAVSMVIRNFGVHHFDADVKAEREAEKEWSQLKNSATLSRLLLEILWGEPRFKDHKEELMRLMKHFGLVVPIRGKVDTFIVPALLTLSGSAERRPEPPEGAPSVLLHFRFGSSALPDLAPVWAQADLRRGFLPEGAFHELCASAVGWTNHTSRGFSPRLGGDFAHVKFGRHELLLMRVEGQPYVSATLLKLEGGKPSEAAPAIDRLRLLVGGVLCRFTNLRCTLLLPLEGDRDDRLVEREALLPANLDSSHVYDVCQKELTPQELAERLAVYLPPMQPPAHYDAFLSYSHVAAFDAPFTERLADCLSGQSPVVTTFLDTRSARLGSDLDKVCLLAMANSRVLVLVVTWNALRRLTTLTASSSLDYVLLEWTFALLQHEQGAQVMPVFIGASDADGTADPSLDLFKARPPRASEDGWGNALDAAGHPIPQPEVDVFERTPDVVVGAVAESLEHFYKKHGLEAPAAIRTWSVRDVITKIAKIWGEATASDHGAKGAGQQAGGGGQATHQLQPSDQWGLEEAVAKSVTERARKAEKLEPPKLLGTSLPAKPASEGFTENAFDDFKKVPLFAFLSHTQRDPDAKVVASELWAELGMKKNMRCWLDVKMPVRDATAMEEGVKEAAALIAIVTDNGERPRQDSYPSVQMRACV